MNEENKIKREINDINYQLRQLRDTVNFLINKCAPIWASMKDSQENTRGSEDTDAEAIKKTAAPESSSASGNLRDICEECIEKCINENAQSKMSEDARAYNKYLELCKRFPLFKFMSASDNMSYIHEIYDCFNIFNVTDQPIKTCGNKETASNFVFHAATPNNTEVCMCIDFINEMCRDDGIKLNFTFNFDIDRNAKISGDECFRSFCKDKYKYAGMLAGIYLCNSRTLFADESCRYDDLRSVKAPEIFRVNNTGRFGASFYLTIHTGFHSEGWSQDADIVDWRMLLSNQILLIIITYIQILLKID